MARRLTPPLPPPLLALVGVYGPSPVTTIRGGAFTFTGVSLGEPFHVAVVLPLKGQFDEQVHQVIVPVSTSLPLRGRPAILPRKYENSTHKPQVGFSGSIETHVQPEKHILQVAHIFRDSRSGRKFREHRELHNLCAHTEIRLVKRQRFSPVFGEPQPKLNRFSQSV